MGDNQVNLRRELIPGIYVSPMLTIKDGNRLPTKMSTAHQVYLLGSSLIRNFHWLLLVSALLFPLLLFFNFRNRRAVLLFSLALPGALGWCAAVIGLLFAYPPDFVARSLALFAIAFPSIWILPSIAIFQLRRLRAPSTNIGVRGFASGVVVVALYAWTTVVDRGL